MIDRWIIPWVYAVEGIIAVQYFRYLFSKKVGPVQLSAAFFFGYALIYGLSLFDNVILNVVDFFVMNLFLQICCFQVGLKAALFHSGIMTFVMTASEFIMNLLLTAIVGDYSAYEYNLLVCITLGLLSKPLFLFVMQSVARVIGPKQEGIGEPKLLLLLGCMPVISTVVSIAVIYVGLTTVLEPVTEILLAISVIGLFIANFIVLLICDSMHKLYEDNFSAQLSSARDRADAEFYRMMLRSEEDQRILIHDMKKHLSTISYLAESANYQGIQNYISEWEKQPGMKKIPRYCDNNLLNVILARHSNICSVKDITFQVDVRVRTLQSLNDLELTALFENLLTNAEEAAEKAEEKEIELSVYARQESHSDVIAVVNTCDSAPIAHPSGLFQSSKTDKEHHGLGMKSARRVVTQKGGKFEAFYEEKEYRFFVIIELPLME